jgi:hypothetical protein
MRFCVIQKLIDIIKGLSALLYTSSTANGWIGTTVLIKDDLIENKFSNLRRINADIFFVSLILHIILRRSLRQLYFRNILILCKCHREFVLETLVMWVQYDSYELRSSINLLKALNLGKLIIISKKLNLSLRINVESL